MLDPVSQAIRALYFINLFLGMEYMVKFNLQKHLEQFHTAEERNTKATELIKVTDRNVLRNIPVHLVCNFGCFNF
jgi:hypothetical protein